MFAPDAEFEAALYGPCGPRSIERIALDPLPSGDFRWSLWSEGEEIYAIELPAEQVADCLQVCAVLLNAALGVPPGPCVPASEWN